MRKEYILTYTGEEWSIFEFDCPFGTDYDDVLTVRKELILRDDKSPEVIFQGKARGEKDNEFTLQKKLIEAIKSIMTDQELLQHESALNKKLEDIEDFERRLSVQC